MNNNLNREANTLAWISVICAFALFCIIMYFCFSCSGQKPETQYIPYIEDEEYIQDSIIKRTINVNFRSVQSTMFDPVDGGYSVGYCDFDQFDHNALMENTISNCIYDSIIICDILPEYILDFEDDWVKWMISEQDVKDSIDLIWGIFETYYPYSRVLRFEIRKKE